MLAVAGGFVWIWMSQGLDRPWLAALNAVVLVMLLAGSLAFVLARWRILRRSTGGAADAELWMRKDRWAMLSAYLFRLVFVILFATFLVTIAVQSLRN
jgi:hypothetical protein